MDLKKIVREKRDEILKQAARHGACNVRSRGIAEILARSPAQSVLLRKESYSVDSANFTGGGRKA